MTRLAHAPTRSDAHSPARRKAIGTTLAAIAGVGVAAQSRINGALGAHLHDGIAAALVSFGCGLVLLLVMTAVLPRIRRGLDCVQAALRTGRLRPWQCLGGACGAYLVTTQGVTVATLGVAIFTVALVAGQSLSSLVVDRLGIGPAGVQPVTTPRVLGSILSIIAVLVAVSDRLGDSRTLALALLPALAGIGVAWQQAVNGRVRDAAHGPLAAAVVNFVVGTTALLLIFAIDLLVRGLPDGRLPAQPIYYLGGPLGVGFIAVAAAVVRSTGVLLLGLGMVAGQLLGALLLDLLIPDGSRPGVATYLGVALTLVAVLLAAAPTRRGSSTVS